jgi:thioester reductase-like protein
MTNTANPHGFDLDEQAVLEPEIKPQTDNFTINPNPSGFFLTGVTGFIGAFLLRDLLELTNADVYCLVRADNPEHALQRVQRNLEKYYIWKPEFASRVHALPGDMKMPLLGFDPDTFKMLTEEVDGIFHCGSKLSYIAPFHYLKAANVGGTHECLRMAAGGKPKATHFVSSLGILMNSPDLIGGNEEDELVQDKCPILGYFQTKYVAERLIRIARDRGMPVTIHRIGLIVGHSRSGAANIDDFAARMIIGCIKAGYAPDVTAFMDMTPVNYVSKAMVKLALRQESMGKVFHLLNPHPIHWGEVFDIIAKAGYPLQKLSYDEWITTLEQHKNLDGNPLQPLVPFFRIDFAQRMLGMSSSYFEALGTKSTLDAVATTGLECPPVDEIMINIFLSEYLRSGGLEDTII